MTYQLRNVVIAGRARACLPQCSRWRMSQTTGRTCSTASRMSVWSPRPTSRQARRVRRSSPGTCSFGRRSAHRARAGSLSRAPNQIAKLVSTQEVMVGEQVTKSRFGDANQLGVGAGS